MLAPIDRGIQSAAQAIIIRHLFTLGPGADEATVRKTFEAASIEIAEFAEFVAARDNTPVDTIGVLMRSLSHR